MLDIFISSATSYVEVGGEQYEIATELQRFKLMTVTQETRHIQEDNFTTINKASYVIALASTDFVKNEILSSRAYGNTDALTAVLRGTGNEVVPTNIPLKSFYEYGIEDQRAYAAANPMAWFWCLVLIPPIAAAITGIVINVRRKYR